MEGALAPFLSWQKARLLRGQVDASFVADPEAARVIGEPVNAEFNADVVKEDVAGFQNRIVQVHESVGSNAFFGVIDPAVIWAAEESAVSGAESREILGRHVIFQHGRRGDDFKARARRQV